MIVTIAYIKRENCTVEVLTPIVAEIKGALSGALVEVNALVGVSADIILASVDGTVQVTIDVLAQLVADLLIVSGFINSDVFCSLQLSS